MPIPQINSSLSIPHLDKFVHFSLFFIFSLFSMSFFHCVKELKSFIAILVTLLLVAIYGGVIEYLQGVYYERSSDIWDWVANMSGGIVGIVLYKKIVYIVNKYIISSPLK